MSLVPPLSPLFAIRAGMNVSVHNPPPGFLEALMLPDGAALVDSSKLGLDVQILFSTTKPALIEQLTRLIQKMAVLGAIWVCVPEKQDPYTPSEDFARLAAVELGLTDVKRIALGSSWKALKLQRKGSSPRPELPEVRA